ncbi:MAG: PilZ domain-containing protein [Vicinamibacterales bacterium]
MPGLRDQVKVEGEILTFADTEPIQALQTILEQRPGLVVLERLFAATPRGAALINRIKSDPQLSHTEVRVMSHTGDYTRQVVKPSSASPASGGSTPAAVAAAPAATVGAAKALDWQGTRRAPRFRVRDGVELHLDGNPAAVIDLSTVGAQVISPTVLRPNQKVRIIIPIEDLQMRFRGAIAWAKFELPKAPAKAAQYRAGVEFTDADAKAIDQFTNRNKS